MEFEWDPAKNAANIAKHGIDFAGAVKIFSGDTVEYSDIRRDYGEIRVNAIGEINGKEIVVIYTPRAEKRRIISARRARDYERAAFRYVYPGQSAQGSN
ncbi:MAG TPA: BrnT family toxin [Alphaproteobacteria bacterium]